MSRVAYQFVSSTSTSWLHEYSCDLCKLKVTREGALPTSEAETNKKMPQWAPGVHDGWSKLSVALPGHAPEGGYDFCSSCTKTLLDSWLAMGIGEPTQTEERYLDAFGGVVVDPQTLAGTRGCWRDECYLPWGHRSDCDLNQESGLWRDAMVRCPRCRDWFESEHALACHAVNHHEITAKTPEAALASLGKPVMRGMPFSIFPDPVQRSPTAVAGRGIDQDRLRMNAMADQLSGLNKKVDSE